MSHIKHFSISILMASVASVVFAQSSSPQLLVNKDKRAAWDNTQQFGPVPENLQKTGDEECKKADYDRAVGFTKQGQNSDGKTYEKGAFLCADNAKSDKT